MRRPLVGRNHVLCSCQSTSSPLLGGGIVWPTHPSPLDSNIYADFSSFREKHRIAIIGYISSSLLMSNTGLLSQIRCTSHGYCFPVTKFDHNYFSQTRSFYQSFPCLMSRAETTAEMTSAILRGCMSAYRFPIVVSSGLLILLCLPVVPWPRIEDETRGMERRSPSPSPVRAMLLL